MPKKKKPKEPVYNQSKVYIHKYIGHRRDQYFTMDILRTNRAMRVLNGNAFKLYIYLCQNSDNTTILLSGSKFSEVLGMPKKSYIIAKQELVKRHYLIEREDGDYDFYNYQLFPKTEGQKIINEIIAKTESE